MREPDPDPLAEPEGPPSCSEPDCRRGCPCGKCHGFGWVQVAPGYANLRHPDPPADVIAGLTPEQADALARTIDAQRAASSRSVYPCRHCRPGLFFRWAGGHLAPGHDAADCVECSETLGKRPRRMATT